MSRKVQYKGEHKRTGAKQRRLSPDDRRKEFVAKATEFFSDEGFGGGTRALARRLGATFLVSNVGAVEIGEPVRSLAFFPQPSGPAGLAIGVVSTAAATSLTVRARRRDFTDDAVADLLARLVVGVRRG